MKATRPIDELAQQQFRANLEDWCAGGPKPGGFTRNGHPVKVPDLTLVERYVTNLEPREIAAKNAAEFQRWHISFLHAHLRGDDHASTDYWNEYLLPRLTPEQAADRARRFVELFESIKEAGISEPAIVAEVPRQFKFSYFRFDGAHRTASAHVLGMASVPTIVYRTHNARTFPWPWANRIRGR